ncbi:MAG: hypothetical protein NC395_06750 [Prevotella sp.]|nr:hypothetical protein [Prevotella sp.]
MKNKIMPFLVLAVFIGGIIGAVAFKDTDPRISVIFAGGIFLFVGLLAFFAQRITPKNAPMLIFCIIGAVIAGIPTWLILAEKYPESVPQPTDKAIVTVMGLICMIIGICVGVFPTVAELYKRRVCTESAMAKCVEVKTSYVQMKHGRRKVYSPVWEFDFYGKTYTADENIYSSDRPEIGDMQEIFFNPFAPGEIYRKGNGAIILAVVIGLAFVAMGIGVCFIAASAY